MTRRFRLGLILVKTKLSFLAYSLALVDHILRKIGFTFAGFFLDWCRRCFVKTCLAFRAEFHHPALQVLYPLFKQVDVVVADDVLGLIGLLVLCAECLIDGLRRAQLVTEI